MNYILDTNIISELIAKQPNPHVIDWIDQCDPQTVYLTVITIGELRKGIEKLPASTRKATLTDWLATDLLLRFEGRILALTTEVMLVWGELTGALELRGTPIAAIDSLIAAIALHGGYTLVTRNERDFRYTGIPVINPWNAA
ncbi:type II toxin-antitoxin system VapC family toxin [Candidatus Oscillochloris fontis]|uniref:type II toxin-antitoxin system VapC family toxin n=1 Tax=Candidatus Oscillochloris fontis TaxID=2496868 RepID=UPI00101CE95E|nr:type II toxin-antitoxin system VapC family toxin [Candidatus Oscillochloris fontis]